MEILPDRSDVPLLFGRPAAFVRRYRWPLLLLLVGATADAITTLVNLRRFGAAVEVHPVQRWVFDRFGVEAGVPVAKVCQLACVLFVAAWWRPWCPWVLGLCGAFYLAAAVSNHFLLL